jgi:putative ATP-binding cassette transporter
MFTTGFNLLVPLIPAIIMAPLYFDGKVEFGVITQSVMAFTVVFNGATLLIAQFGGISAFAAVTNRVGSLLEELGSAKQTGKTSVLAADNSCAYAVKEAVCENRG